MTDLLDTVLADSRVAAVRDLRQSHADRARAAQRSYRRYFRLFVIATALATIAGALILLGTGGGTGAASDAAQTVGEKHSDQQQMLETLQAIFGTDSVRTALFIFDVGALATAAYAAEMLRESRSGTDWFVERRAAELGRVELFDTIMTVAREAGPEAERAAFEHFVEKQLGRQITYHEKAEARHRRSADWSTAVGALIAAAIAASGATGIGGTLWITIAAFVGVIAPILLNALRSWRESELDREKSERYRAAWAELKRLSAGVDAARADLEAGKPEAARELVTAVHNVMRAENEVWAPTGGKS